MNLGINNLLGNSMHGKLARLNIFGDDYPTKDGIGVRDFIHFMVIAEGHLTALEKITTGVYIYNLGTQRGTSVLELLSTFEETKGLKFPYEIVERRPGDVAECYADVSKAENSWAGRQSAIW